MLPHLHNMTDRQREELDVQLQAVVETLFKQTSTLASLAGMLRLTTTTVFRMKVILTFFRALK